MLRDLSQWAGASAPAAECSPPGDPRAPRYLQRLQRLEAAADAAGSRFEALQREHASLKRQHHKLKQRLRERERGAGDGAAAAVASTATGSERATAGLSSASFRDAVSARVGV